jgi:hypothetical protein
MRFVTILFFLFYLTDGLISSFAFASGICAVRCADSTKGPCDEACAAGGCCKPLSALPSQARTESLSESTPSTPLLPHTATSSRSSNDIFHVPKPRA